MSSPTATIGDAVTALLAVATAPALVTDGTSTFAEAPASPTSNSDARGEVLGDQRTSAGLGARPRTAATLSTAAGAEGSGPWLLLLILALIAVAAATPLLLRRRRETEPEATPQVEPAPAQVPVQESTPAPPAEPQPPPLEDTSPPASPPHHGARHAAGLAITGMASLAVTLLMRARRRR